MSSLWPPSLSRILSFLKPFPKVVSEGIELLLPSRCIACNTLDPPFVQPMFCQQCWESIFHPTPLSLLDSNMIPYQAFSCGSYDNLLYKLIVRAKFHADPLALPPLLRLMDFSLSQMVGEPIHMITSVPPSVKRLRKRGLDLPGYLARKISKKKRVSYFPKLLTRIHETPSQTSLSRTSRVKNVDGVFVCHDKKVKDQHVLVIDDVFTTGATALATSRVLIENGALQVTFLAACRALLDKNES